MRKRATMFGVAVAAAPSALLVGVHRHRHRLRNFIRTPSARCVVPRAGGVVGATNGAKIDLKNVGGYDVVTNERFDIDLRAVGIAVKHLSINVEMMIPRSLSIGRRYCGILDPGRTTTP